MSRGVQIPSDSSQFDRIRQMISEIPFEFVPRRVDPTDPSTSIGAMILMDMFSWPWHYTALTNGTCIFIRNNPALFVPGSYSIDMTGIGMPPLDDQQTSHLLASRTRINLPLFHVDYDTIPRDADEFELLVCYIKSIPQEYIYDPEREPNPRLSIGQAITRQRFPNYSYLAFGPFRTQLRRFIIENPSLFVPGSYHTDMTRIGMPQLTSDQEDDLMAEREAMSHVASPAIHHVREARVITAIQPKQFRQIGEDCPVCMEQLEADGSTLLNCGHLYHASCLFRMPLWCCPECKAHSLPLRGVLNDSVHAEIKALRDRLQFVNDKLKETEEKLEETTDRLEETTSKLEEMMELHNLERVEYMARNEEIEDTCAKLQEDCALEIKSLNTRIESLHSTADISLEYARNIVSAVECAGELASMAREVLDENLLKTARPGLVLHRLKDERNGLIQLVETMTDDLNRLAALAEMMTTQRDCINKRVEEMHRNNDALLTKVNALENELRRLGSGE